MKKATFLLLCFCFAFTFATQASILKKSITLKVENEQLGDVLKKIETIANISFAYESSAINKNRLVSLNVSNTLLGDVLKILLYEDGAKFTAVGNQIIIFQPNFNPKQTKSVKPVQDTIWTQVINTIYVTDTNFVHIYDTIKVRDTLYVKVLEKEKHKKPKNTNFDYLQVNYDFKYNNIAFSEISDTSLSINKGNQIVNGLGFSIVKSSNNWNISTGVGFINAQQSLPYSKYEYFENIRIDSIPYYVTSYDSMFIAIPNVDTLWIIEENVDEYFVESKVIEKGKNINEAEVKNSLYYISIPISVSYNFKIDRRTSFEISLATKSNILLQKKYSELEYLSAGAPIKYSIKPQTVYLQANLGVGLNYWLRSDYVIQVLPYTSFLLSPMYDLEDIKQKKTFQIGLHLGIKKSF